MTRSRQVPGEIRNFRFPAPAIDQRQIFRELIATEIRNGRMSQFQRARIVRFAAQLGLSAVETGRLIAECQESASFPYKAQMDTTALGIAESAPRSRRLSPRVAIVTGVLILIIWLLRL